MSYPDSSTSSRHFVIGGAGFLGSHIVRALKERNGQAAVVVFDIVDPPNDERVENVEYVVGDINNEAQLAGAMKEFNPSVVYHTASPLHGLEPSIYDRVNVEGTRHVLSTCKAAGVKNLVFTSSTGVVWTGAELVGVDEDGVRVPARGYDAYHHTKAIAERLVLEANGVDGVQVVALRLCGMFGERDKQLTPKLAKILKDGQQNVQIGDNKNVVDYMYVGNAADAHLLAADCLLEDASSPVSGQVFFITNGSPMPNWSFNRLLWRELGDDGSKKIVVLPRGLAMFMAFISEMWSKLTRTPTEFNRFNIRFLTGVQWYKIDKARRLLKYEPHVTLEEGIKRTAEWWKQHSSPDHKQKKD